MSNVLHNVSLDGAIADARERYTLANQRSLARHEQAKRSLPGGNTRSVLWYEPFPVALASGRSCTVTDVDGHDYVDFVSEYSAGLYGHSDPIIGNVISEVVKNGVALGGPNLYEALLAEELVSRFPALDRVRFCNSGTEANIMALSAARAITGREKIVVFREGYHGGVLTFAHGGSPLNIPFPFLLADYNDVDGTEAILRENKDTIAAVILEQMLGGGGCIRASDAFLSMLRRVSSEIGALLIFDEVMTSRLDFGGMQSVTGIIPDLMTLGKYVGGGASFGAFGGRADLMDCFDPMAPGAFNHGGTFNNNIISMAAGYTGLKQVLTRDASQRFNQLGEQLKASLRERIDAHGIAASVTGYGSLINLHFIAEREVSASAVEGVDRRFHHLWHLEMLMSGYYVTPRGMIALALPHRQADVDGLVSAFDLFLRDYRSLFPQASAGRKGAAA